MERLAKGSADEEDVRHFTHDTLGQWGKAL